MKSVNLPIEANRVLSVILGCKYSENLWWVLCMYVHRKAIFKYYFSFNFYSLYYAIYSPYIIHSMCICYLYMFVLIFFLDWMHTALPTAQREHHLFCIKLLGISELNAWLQRTQHIRKTEGICWKNITKNKNTQKTG